MRWLRTVVCAMDGTGAHSFWLSENAENRFQAAEAVFLLHIDSHILPMLKSREMILWSGVGFL
jgi:hypothetical protein